MAEYINREELLKDIDDSVRFSTRNGVSAELRGAHKIVDCIRSAPACDVVEVVHGEWVYKKEKDGCFCSVCDIEALIDPNFIGRDFAMEELSDYCPHCGAKMDGERMSDDG
jgi:hypothetical protein